MILLDTATKSLQVLLAGAVATTELPIVAAFADMNQSGGFAITAISGTDTQTNGATPVTAVAAPAAATTRKINTVEITNVDTAPVIITVRLNDNGTLRPLISALTLAVGSTLQYADGAGWKVVNSSGELLVTTTTGAPADADYLVKTANGGLSAERVVTDTTSIVWDWATGGQAKATRAALTGDVTAAANANATTIANDAVTTLKILDANVTNAKLANMATKTVKGRTTAGTGVPEDIAVATTLKTDLVLVKGDVGLGNVDNTSDAGKPVSTAQQTALDLKANLASPALTGNPTAPTQAPKDNSTKLASTAYVENAVLGQNFKEACKYGSTTALPAIVYANGSSGVGATLTAVGFGALSFDGSTPSVGDRVLIKNQVTTFQNGIYTVTVVGGVATLFILTRATDFDQSSDIETGGSCFITTGTTLSATTWAYTGIDNPVMGTDAITFVQTAGQGALSAGDGITITGNSIAVTTGFIATKVDAAANKATPVDADKFALIDSAAGQALKSTLWSDIKATLKSYFDTIYPLVAFKTIAVSGQSDVVADGTADTLTLVAGSNVTLTTNAVADSVTIAAAGGSGALTLLKAGSGTTTNTIAENLDTVAISGLTALDYLYVVATFEAITQAYGALDAYNDTDTTRIGRLSDAYAAGSVVSSIQYVVQSQNSTTNLFSYATELKIPSPNAFQSENTTVTTAWTGSWTWALRSAGVTSGGTLRWKYRLYKVAGQ